MRPWKWVLLLPALCLAAGQPLTRTLMAEVRGTSSWVTDEDLTPSITELVHQAIRNEKIPGAVVLIGSREKVLFRGAFGNRAIEPSKRPMTVDTIFDLGSLTKAVATTTAVMQLVQSGKVRLEDPVAEYWPAFKKNGKGKITLRQLLTHYSGLREGLDLRPAWSGYRTAIEKVLAERPVSAPGTHFCYSDINFIVLGELVSLISSQPLEDYCAEHIFRPLEMKDTVFKPAASLWDRIAPTQYKYGPTGKKMLCGEVHDPVSYCMGGVAGHSGLFSTAEDLSIFAQTLLNGGKKGEVSILSPLAVEKMTTPQNPINKTALRGLGWDIDSPYSANRGELFPIGSYGHTGFPGTSIWIDPFSGVYVILLTNQIHPYGKTHAMTLSSKIATLVASYIKPPLTGQVLSSRLAVAGTEERITSYRGYGLRQDCVQTGIDVLSREGFARLDGLRVGLITNHSGLDSGGRRTIDLFRQASGVKLVCIFSPEHGLSGTRNDRIMTGREAVTGLTVHSLYGDTKRPTEGMLKGIDGLAFDIQDSGVRFYTYITTMAYAMEAAAKKKIPFFVLDRPNPINAASVQGPVLENELRSFTGCFPLPVRHGMTLGELATMFNSEDRIGTILHVIKMRGYSRTDWYDETGLKWVNPSPNIRTLAQAVLYPGVAMVEGANVSVGRGTHMPFEVLGAPWINGKTLSEYLNRRNLPGVRFMPVDFVPDSDRFEKQLCHGIQVVLMDRQALDSPALGVEISSGLFRLYPEKFQVDKILPLVGSSRILGAIKAGQDPRFIAQDWREDLEVFRLKRAKYLLY